MVDIAGELREEQNEKAFMDFGNEMMQINHVSQLYIGLNVFSLLFF
jgi:NADPH:quinone reductase-like Zn-dependent oxidoreductase